MKKIIDLSVFYPSPHLKNHIHSYQVLEFEPVSLGWDKIIPYGYSTIVIHYGMPWMMKKKDSEDTFILPEIFATGLTSSPFHLRPTGYTAVVTVLLHPTSLAAIINESMWRLTDDVLDLRLVMGDELELFYQQFLETAGHAEKVRLIEHFLGNKIRNATGPPEVFTSALMKLRLGGGNISVKKLADNLGISQSKLERGFRTTVGISPKNYSGIIRFNQVFRHLKNSSIADIQDLIYQCGYYDQSHFIKDFKRYAGESPIRYLQSAHPYADVFTGK